MLGAAAETAGVTPAITQEQQCHPHNDGESTDSRAGMRYELMGPDWKGGPRPP